MQREREQAGEVLDASLLEREAAQRRVLAAIGEASAGRGSGLFVVGPAGIGKTSVLAAGRRAARAAGFTVAAGVGSPMEARLAFGLFGQALVAIGGSAVDDAAELERLGGQPARLYRTFRFLVEVSKRVPLLLLLDDLQWADADSLELLGFVCRRLGGTRILVLGALRPEPDLASAVADELAGSGHASMVGLRPLSREAASQLLGRLVPGEEAERRRVIEACGGSPLLLRVAASTLSSDGSLPRLGEGGFGRALLAERFVGLGDDAFAYVRAAAILGVRFRPALAGELAGIEELLWRRLHVRLTRGGLLDDLGGGWSAFVHPLFAQAVLDAVPRSERELAHAEAFRVLVARGEPDAVAAEHAVAARLSGDPLAVEVTARAGREAFGQGALRAAGELLGNAVGLAGAGASFELRLDHATALTARGHFEEALAICERLVEAEDATAEIRCGALALMGRAAAVSGEPRRGEELYERAIAAAESVPERLAQVLADAAFTCHVSSPMSWLIPVTSRALELIDEASPLRRSIEILNAYGRLMAGDGDQVELVVRDAGDWFSTARGGEHSWSWTLGVHVLNGFKMLGDLHAATVLFEREFPRAVEAGAPMLINALAIAYADVAHRLGRIEEALELVQQASAVSELRMSPWYEIAHAALLSDLGRDAEAATYIEALRAVKAAHGPDHYAAVGLWFDLLEARRLLAGGRAAEASDLMLDAAEVAELSGWREPSIVPWAGTGIEAHLAAGFTDRARALVGDLERLSAPLSCVWPRAVLALGRARLAAVDGSGADADGHFEQALAILEQLPLVLARADALVAYGAYLRRSGRPSQARAPLAQALELCERTSLERVARIARAELAACGGRRRRDSEQRSQLTPQEQRVAALAADGMSNAQIAAALTLSRKTVDNHLQQIYFKLGIHSRRELILRGARPAER